MRTAGLLFLEIGLFGAAAGQWLVRPLLGLIRTPAGIFSAASRYLRIYLLGHPALLLYDLGAAVLRARGDSRYPFLALTAAGAVNVVLDLFFVAGLHLGVAGIAIATGLSTALSALLVLRRVGKDPLFSLLRLPDTAVRAGAAADPAAEPAAVHRVQQRADLCRRAAAGAAVRPVHQGPGRRLCRVRAHPRHPAV